MNFEEILELPSSQDGEVSTVEIKLLKRLKAERGVTYILPPEATKTLLEAYWSQLSAHQKMGILDDLGC